MNETAPPWPVLGVRSPALPASRGVEESRRGVHPSTPDMCGTPPAPAAELARPAPAPQHFPSGCPARSPRCQSRCRVLCNFRGNLRKEGQHRGQESRAEKGRWRWWGEARRGWTPPPAPERQARHAWLGKQQGAENRRLCPCPGAAPRSLSFLRCE